MTNMERFKSMSSDNEIIKAFECCYLDKPCKECPLYNSEDDICTSHCDDLSRKILELINRQKAEIESLERRLHNAQLYQKETYKELQAERMLRFKESFIKAEAVKEFAERLKAVSHPYADTQMVFELQIDNLLKEMVGENK